MQIKFIISIILLVLFSTYAYAELTKKDIEEIRRIIKEEVNESANSLRSEMNTRFEAMNKRIDDIIQLFHWIYILLSAIIALNGAMVGSVVWLAVQDRPIARKHYDKIIAREDEFETRLFKLEKSLQSHLGLAHAE